MSLSATAVSTTTDSLLDSPLSARPHVPFLFTCAFLLVRFLDGRKTTFVRPSSPRSAAGACRGMYRWAREKPESLIPPVSWLICVVARNFVTREFMATVVAILPRNIPTLVLSAAMHSLNLIDRVGIMSWCYSSKPMLIVFFQSKRFDMKFSLLLQR